MSFRFMLRHAMFEQTPRQLACGDYFTITTFQYETGVEALEISSSSVSYILLPYQGLQIWRLFIDGENMTMKSMFDMPEDTTNVFDESYGGFLIHCGLTAMGNPSEEDPHPMHGELPHAKYNNVFVEIGEDENGQYISLSGDYCFKCSIDTGYVFKPELRLYEGQKVLKMNCHIKNLRSTDFHYMYMAHINWLPVNGSRIIYSTPKDKTHIEVFRGDFSGMLDEHAAKRLDDYTSKLQNDPNIGDVIDFDTQCYNPELCSSMHYQSDEALWAHAMQLRPDKTACYVGFDTQILQNGLRWFSWTGEEQTCGFALPNTGNHMGRAYAIQHGLRKNLHGNEEVTLRYRFGKLDAEDAAAMERKINKILE